MNLLVRITKHLVLGFGFLGFALAAAPAFAATVTTSVTTTSAAAPSCLPATLPRMTLGSTGTIVSQLQNFLVSQGLFTVAPTGYFGSVTMHAVQAFQAKNGIVSSGSPSSTGYGAVGPRTLSAFRMNCGGTPVGGTQTTITNIDGQTNGLSNDMNTITTSLAQGDDDDTAVSSSSNGAVQSELGNIDSLMQGLLGDNNSSQSAINQGDSE